MKRFFASDAESDMLIAEATKTFGLKIGDIINMAIKNQFLPITEPFRTEARFILQRHPEAINLAKYEVFKEARNILEWVSDYTFLSKLGVCALCNNR